MKKIIRFHLRRSGTSMAVVVALALGIGATSAVVTLVHMVLFRPLPFPNSDRLAVLWEHEVAGGADFRITALPNFRDWQARSASFEALACSIEWLPTMRLADDLVRVNGVQVTAGFFDVLRVEPAAGRLLSESDFLPGAPPTVVASYDFWQRRFGGDPDFIGRPLTLDGQAVTVVGVLPSSVVFTRPAVQGRAELVGPLDESVPWFTRGNRMFRAIGLLREGANLGLAAEELESIAVTLAAEYPESNAGWTVDLESLRRLMVGDVERSLYVLLAAAALVLLVACVNAANLLAVQITRRQRELAIRTALGSSGRRLLGQLLAESVPLVALGALGGFLLAQWTLGVFADMLPENVVWILGSRTGVTAFAGALLAGLITVGLIMALPGLAFSALPIAGLLAEESAGAGESRRSHAARQAIIVCEVALSLMLVIGATLLIRSFFRLSAVKVGFDSEDVLIVKLELPLSKYASAPSSQILFAEVLGEITRDPRVSSSAVVNHLPLDGGNHLAGLSLAGVEVEDWQLDLRGISSDYFSSMKIPLVRGRSFTREELENRRPIVVLNETAANRLWRGRDPIGRTLTIQWGDALPREVIGVAADVRHENIAASAGPEAYLPFTELPVWVMHLVVRSTTEPMSLATEVRSILHRADPDVLIVDMTALERIVDRKLAKPRQYSKLLAVFAGVGVLLAVLGIYGVTSYVVSTRIRELGIRLALGAKPRDLVVGLVAQATRVVALGTFLGVAGAWLLSQSMQTLLYEVEARDPLTFSFVPLAFAGVALLAAYLPSRRAMSVDPAKALTLGD